MATPKANCVGRSGIMGALVLKLALEVIHKIILDKSNKLLHFKISFIINFTICRLV